MFQSIILGIIQGLTEFIPVSSSGHLALLPKLFNWEEQSTSFDVILHGGTLFALLFVYRFKLLDIFKSIGKDKTTNKLVINIVIATIPAAVIGLIFKDTIDDKLKSNWIIAFMLVQIGLLLILADFYLKKRKPVQTKKPATSGKGQYTSLSSLSALLIGLAQPISFIRGTSRSGITTLAGLTQKMDLKSALDFSFLISIPIITMAFAYGLLDILKNGAGDESFSNMAAGFLASFISGLIAINFMLKFTARIGLKWFGVYRIILGLVVILIII